MRLGTEFALTRVKCKWRQRMAGVVASKAARSDEKCIPNSYAVLKIQEIII